jgi:uncharacterized protein YchJ
MNVTNGAVLPFTEVENLPESEKAKYVPVVRDLTEIEKLNQQIKLYSLCGCGSGKKFKFCCFQKPT